MKSKYMKRIMLLATAVLTMSSCDSFLDTSPEDLRSPEQIYETYSSTQNAMFGVYSYIRGTYPFDMPDTYSTTKAISNLRNITESDRHFVIIINNTITIQIAIFNITRTQTTMITFTELYRTAIDFFL